LWGNKIISVSVATLLLFAITGSFVIPSRADGTITFSDIAAHWGKESILQGVASGYVDGYPDGTFMPDREISRAEFIKLVVNALDFKATAVINGQPWYQSSVNTAIANGIHDQADFNDDGIDQPITREEMSRIAVRATGEANYDSKKWMYLATKEGIIQGLDDTGTLAAEGVTTRSQAITVIERIKKVRVGEKLDWDKHAVSRAEVAWHKTNIFTMMPELFDKMIIETEDGLFKGEATRILAVDVADPNDPFRDVLGDIESLMWKGGGNHYYRVSDYPDSYLLFVDFNIIYNNDSNATQYSQAFNRIRFYLSGIERPDSNALKEGNLNSFAWVYKNREDELNAMILPKHGLETRGYLSISLSAPAIPPTPDAHRDVISVTLPKVID
jgi:hypothetical protein